MQLSKKPEAFVKFSWRCGNCHQILIIFEKKIRLKHRRSFWIRTTCLLKCEKVPVRKLSSDVNVLTGPSNCWYLQRSFGFLDNFIWIGCGKFPLILRDYLLSVVNVLTNSLSIPDLGKRVVFQLNLS